MERNTELLNAEKAGILRASALLREGQLVSFPTETVYGLGATAVDDKAIARVFEAKNRPTFNPLIIHVADLAMAQQFGVFSQQAEKLANAFWPGPLSLVVPLKPDVGLSPLALAGHDTVALRVPSHPVALEVLRAVNGPVAAPSANPSGALSPTTAAHVLHGLGGKIAAILDGGPCGVGVESTIVDCSTTPTLLRHGGVVPEDLMRILGQTVLEATAPSAAPKAPGLLRSHYAPKARVRLNALAPEPGEVLLGFGPNLVDATLNLSPTGDTTEAAANLFRCLAELDATGAASIAVSPVPKTGLGLAINDRLERAAAPRTDP